MSGKSKIRLSELREIGWSEWDPISLKQIDPDWRANGGDDEYDSYILHVAGLLRNGHPEADAAAYLVWVETDHMGLAPKSTSHARAVSTVRAVRTYLDSLDD